MKRPHYSHLFSTQLHERNAIAAKQPLMNSSTGKSEVAMRPPITPNPSKVAVLSPMPPNLLSVSHQTSEIFNRYSQCLTRHGCTLERNCIRTWIFVQDVDVQYSGMVAARREYFEREGLTPQTHYIASTGIEGRYIYPDVLAMMDAYAIAGVEPGQVKYLKAHTHLSPTYIYGVTFERGASVDYGDRRHVFISGTASINNRGEIVYPLDVEKQTAHTFDNVQALLAEAGAGIADVAYMIVYLRDTADYALVKRYLDAHYPAIPCLTVLAPVCRPGWLVEVECMAILPVNNNQFAPF